MTLRFFLFLIACTLLSSVEAKPRVAVWNPETGTTSSRFKIDLDWLNQVTNWLAEGGVETVRLKTEQIEDTETFSAAKFDALMLPGDAFPRRTTQSLQRFSAGGGVLISLGAGPVPFLTAIEKPPGGTWTPSPVAPDKAWETSDIYNKVFGLVYNDVPARRNDGVHHAATPFFKKYLTAPPDAPEIKQPLPSRWMAPRLGAEVYPLIRSRRADARDTVPQLFIVQNKTPDATQTGIVAISDFFTKMTTWPLTKETVIALAKIAADLKSGVLQLAPDDKMELRDDEPDDL